jgi:Fe-S cluster assembly protein SufD
MEQQELVSVSSSHHEPEWFIKRRIESFKKIDTLPLLQLQRFKYNTWPLCEEKGLLWQDSSKDLYQETSKADFKIVQLGQTTLEVKIPAELKAKGVILTDIFTALVEYPEIAKKYLYSVLDPNTERDLAYNAAFMNSGIFLYVPKN